MENDRNMPDISTDNGADHDVVPPVQSAKPPRPGAKNLRQQMTNAADACFKIGSALGIIQSGHHLLSFLRKSLKVPLRRPLAFILTQRPTHLRLLLLDLLGQIYVSLQQFSPSVFESTSDPF